MQAPIGADGDANIEIEQVFPIPIQSVPPLGRSFQSFEQRRFMTWHTVFHTATAPEILSMRK